MAQVLEPPVDGRRARRERSRLAVVDAVFALLEDGKVPLTVDEVAERAGVSVSSVFRNFDGLDDMQRVAFDVFQARYASLFEPVTDDEMARADRVGAHVRARVKLYDNAGPMLHIARQRAIDYPPMAAAVGRSRSRLADQAHEHFREEATLLSPASAANLLSVIDSMTSPEAYQVMSAAHGRSHRQVGRSWVTAIDAILTGWPGLPAVEPIGHARSETERPEQEITP